MKTDEELLEGLKEAVRGLLFMSESDYPFTLVRWEVEAITEDFLREQAGKESDAPVTSQSVEYFFRIAVSEPDWKGKEALAVAKRYQALLRFLKENLTDLKAYRVGEIEIEAFVVGLSPARNWLGISTRLIET